MSTHAEQQRESRRRRALSRRAQLRQLAKAYESRLRHLMDLMEQRNRYQRETWALRAEVELLRLKPSAPPSESWWARLVRHWTREGGAK